MISVELRDEEAQAFRLFREHQSLFLSLLDARIHDIRNGEMTLYFSPDGVLMDIVVRLKVFHRVKGLADKKAVMV